MPTPKKRKPAAKRKACKPNSKCCNNNSAFDGFLADFVANKTTVLVLMAAVLGMGAMFSMMLGVSAASF
ncbi:MAG: hypothetical protein P1P90_00665 [Patescibacteria group bacterium]|nr:hypothetical protein [Patescibacteria group bacterium]